MSLSTVRHRIVGSTSCPRLRAYCTRVAREKKRAHRDDTYWGRPVPGFGDPRARLLVLGLAPAAHGANRTGRVFTGDGSGDFLMAALHRAGFASLPTSQRIDDGLTLRDAYIAAAVRCAPPDNTPTPEELARCLPHLMDEVEDDALYRFGADLPVLIGSYHPSRQNTNTGRLTPAMLDGVFRRARREIMADDRRESRAVPAPRPA